ncbi:hypothetical protein [Prochlorococcus marinus]|uniref:hypothetical protein n=1 Tax=Prochlorococcus marinus TaxID=1219 RepID=UPI0022B422D2|nr:hypothetical protein [Prochlorococcus marinus]
MNIHKFLIIDSALVIAAIPIIFLLQGGKKKYPLLRNSNKERLLNKTSTKLPQKEKLIELEKLAKIQGSGIKIDSIVGNWRFISVWKKDIDEEDLIFSSMLKIFAANIEFKKNPPTNGLAKFSVITSIKLGILTIEFSGSGFLEGDQPLLTYFFNLIELKLGSKILLSRSLKEQVDEDKSFFSLIALEEDGEWLSARVQGGALVIWLKD